MPTHQERATGVWLFAAFAAVYVLWGSTYLAIRVAIETIPPFVMVGLRFLIAGALLYAWAILRGADRPSQREWRAAAITGLLTLGGGNGAVVWAEQHVPTGITALIVAVVPLWMVLLDWMVFAGRRPGAGVVAGLLIGLSGLALLVGPDILAGHGQVGAAGTIVLLLGSVSWAIGSILYRHGANPRSAQVASAVQMLTAGSAFAVLSVATGELSSWRWRDVSTPSWLGLMYLVIFGSLIGFTAYVYVVRSTTPAKASTYAYVNPVVALFLGWLILGEPLSWRTVIAAGVILGGVAMMTLARRDLPAGGATSPALGEPRDASAAARRAGAATTGLRVP